MKPIKYTKEGNKVKFHYKYSQLKSFLKRGFKYGNNGMILTGREGAVEIYKGFGTIENPRTVLYKFAITHFTLFDGERPTPEEIVNPKKKKREKNEHRFAVLDVGKIN